MGFDEIEQSWKAGRPKPVYVFHGEEEFPRSELLRLAPDLLVPDLSTRSFNFDTLYGNETNLRDVISIAQGFPMMADRRLLIVKNAERVLKTKASDEKKTKGKQKGDDPLLRYLESPNPETVLIFDMAKLGPRNQSPFKELAAKAAVFEFEVLKEGQVLAWLKSRAKRLGRSISEGAARLMVGHLGNDLRTHANELEKLITYIHDRDQITEQDVEQVVGVSRTYNVFELTKLIGQGDKRMAAQTMLKMLAADRDQRHLLFVMLAKYLEQLIIARECLSRGDGERAIVDTLELRGGAAFFVKDYITAAKRYTRERLDNAMKALIDAERQTRRTAVDETLLMERVLVAIMP
jgi:DNA polymerase III subunit delta